MYNFSVFLSSYRNSSRSWKDGEMLWENKGQANVPQQALPDFCKYKLHVCNPVSTNMYCHHHNVIPAVLLMCLKTYIAALKVFYYHVIDNHLKPKLKTYLSSQMTAFKSRWFVGSSNISRVGSINRALKKVNHIKGHIKGGTELWVHGHSKVSCSWISVCKKSST